MLWLTVVMYLRFSERTNADGTVVRYVALAHNRRVDGKIKPDVLMNLGRVDRLDVDGLLRLAASIRKHFGDGDGLTDSAEAGLVAGAAPMEVADARPIGAAWLLDGLWARLEIGQAIKRVADGRRFTTAVERVLFALVCNRAIEPMSKLSAAEWATEDVAIPGLATMDDDQAYRAMDMLVEADTQGQVQEAVFFAIAHLLNLEVDVLFFDTTSTYFERDDEDEPGEGERDGQAREGFRRYGKSKDHRDDLPQIVIGLAVTRTGIPVRVWCWPGNTQDQTVLAEVKDDLRAWKLGRVITVVDRGFSAADNLAYLRRAGGHYIAGMRMRDRGDLVEAALSRQGRYQQVRDNLRVKEVRLDGTDQRWVICHNPTRPNVTRPSATRRSVGSRPNWTASAPNATAPASSPTRPDARPRPPTYAPSAPCATTPPSAAGCASSQTGGWSSTVPRSRPKPGWTANTCSPRRIPTSAPRTSPWATRIYWKPSAASGT